MELARRLPVKEFPETGFVLVPLNRTDWVVAFSQQKYQAICFVGRLGLYGGDVVQRWSCKDARYRFLRHDKPDNCPSHGLDEDYHCIVERLDDGYAELLPHE